MGGETRSIPGISAEALLDALARVSRELRVAFTIIDREGRFVVAEGKLHDAMQPKLLGESLHARYGDRDQIVLQLQRALAGETTVNASRVHDITFEAAVGPLRGESGEVVAALGLALETTERTRVEEHFANVLEHAPVSVFVVDRDGKVVLHEGAVARRVGLEAASTVGRSVREVYRDQPTILAAIDRALAGDDARIDATFGDTVLRVHLGPVRGDHGALAGVIGVCTDVTEQVRAEDALRRSEERLALAMTASTAAIWDVDFATGALYVSPRWNELLGRADDPPRTYTESVTLIHPDDRARISEEAFRFNLDPTCNHYEQEMRLQHRDGTYRWMVVRTHVVRDAVGLALRVVGSINDVTERKQMQARLLQADRMVSVGTLAAGVAHEINNPLTYILANLAYVERQLPTLSGAEGDVERSRELTQMIADAREGAERVRDIVRDLKLFSRPDEDRQGAVDVRLVLDSTIQMAWNALRHRARLTRSFAEVPNVEGNESRLAQVFLNLLVNAAQSIPEGDVERNEVAVAVTSEGDSVIVSVSDTGAGIDPGHLPRIFDPFFTTKPVGVGTGLGLSICQSIVGALGGTIAVESTPGKGSTFRVRLPAARGSTPQPLLGPHAEPKALPPLHALIVDDEPSVGQALGRLLRGLGVSSETDTGERAVQRLLAPAAAYDVVFCDLMMPEVDGPQLYDRVRAARPALAERFVFMSGGAFTSRDRAFLDRVHNPRVDKPFDLDAIRAAVLAVQHPSSSPPRS